MANPYITRAGPFYWPYAPMGPSGDHVTGQANNTTVGLGYVKLVNTVGNPLGDLILPPWQVTSGPSVSGTGTFTRWLVIAEATLFFTGGIDPTSGDDLTAQLTAYLASEPSALAAIQYETIKVFEPSTAYTFLERFIRPTMGNLPYYIGSLFQNQSGGSLNSTASTHSITYSLDQ